jgi:hypothetical protein
LVRHKLLNVATMKHAPDSTIRVRSFSRGDLKEVSRLWLKIFAPAQGVLPPTFESYFEDVFLANPWQGHGLSSLVCEDRQGAVVGFIGVLPRRMRFCGEPLTVAVASQFMIDPDRALPFASVALLRRFFSGKQDLSFSDGANRQALEIWAAAGGSSALLYSWVWTRVLRPVEYAARLCNRRLLSCLPMRAVQPICRTMDAAATRFSASPYSLPATLHTTIEERVDAAVLLDCIRKFSARRALQPEYDLSSFRWLLDKAAEQQTHGDLQTAVVKCPRGNTLGWYVCYVRPGGIGQILQLGGDLRHIDRVLEHLFHRAHEHGAVAISGQLEPSFVRALARAHCRFTWSGGVIIQSRNERLLNAIHRGDAFLSRLEGEWWMRFCDLYSEEA